MAHPPTRPKTLSYQITLFGPIGADVRQGYVAAKKDNTVICFVHFRKNELDIEVLRGGLTDEGQRSKGFFDFDDPKGAAVERKWTYKDGSTGHSYRIHMKSPDEVEYTMYLLKQKHHAI